MTLETILIVVGIGSFGVASVLAVMSFLRPVSSIDRWILHLTIVGITAFAALLISHGFRSARFPAFGRFEAFTCYGLAIVAAYLHMTIRHRTRGIAGILFPYVTILLIFGAPAVNTEMELRSQWPGVWLSMHIITAFAGYALFTLASILAVTYLIQDHNLKHKRFGTLFERLPALETLDHLMRQQIGLAFLMLSISIVFGVLMVRLSAEAEKWITDPKVMATAATWIAYAILVHMRTRADRHGKKVALATIAGLFFVLFTFFGVHLIAESVHDFVLATPTGN